MSKQAKILAMLIVLVLVASASARVITVEVEGVVDLLWTYDGFAFDDSVNIGSAITGFCTYDTDTADQAPSEYSGAYPLISISMTIGNYTFTHDPASHALFRVGYDGGPFYRTMSYSPRFDGTIYVNGSPKTYDDIIWDGWTYLLLFELGTLSSISPRTYALPTSFPDISLFDWVRGFRTYFGTDDGSSFQIYGEITSLTVVPPPFEVTPASVDFHYYIGEANPEPQTLSIWAKEVDTLNWQITEDCNWLDVSPPSGQSSGEVDEVTLSVDISGLAPGSYHCQLTIFDPNVSDYVLHLPVNLFIGAKLYVPSQYLTIQAAIDAAENFDMVLVADGTYTGPGNRDIDFLGKPITVRSESGPENCIIDCNGTGAEYHRGFYFQNNESHNAVVEGFTITNGHAPYGGGIWCTDNSSPTITNCIISGNSAWIGGGIFCEESSLTITNCTISGNSAYEKGGGIFCNNSPATITNCTISGNSAEWWGGGMCNENGSNPVLANCTFSGNLAGYQAGGICNYESNPTLTNCTFSGNSAYWGGGGMLNYVESNPVLTNCTFSGNSGSIGGGMLNSESSNPTLSNCTFNGNLTISKGGGIYNVNFSSPTLTNCIFSGNSSSARGGGLANRASNPMLINCTLTGNSAKYGGGIFNDVGNLTLIDCILWSNEASDGPEINGNVWVSYSNIQGGWRGQGNIDADPCFVEPGYWDTNGVWVEGDYHLLRTSPCVDAASDANVYTDIEGNSRPFDFPGVDNNGELPEFDMGAYELIPVEAAMKLTPQMLNCNSKGKYVKAHITLPEGFLPQDVDVNEPAVAEPMGIESEYIKVLGSDKSLVRLEIYFDREAFCYLLTDDDSLEVTVIGSLTTSRYFYATDTIKIKSRR